MEVWCMIFLNVSMDQPPYKLFQIETSCILNCFKLYGHYDLWYFEIESGPALKVKRRTVCVALCHTQLLVWGVGAVSTADALWHALADTKNTLNRLSPGPESVPQPPLSRRRVKVIKLVVIVKISYFQLPAPEKGHAIYSYHQTISIIKAFTCDCSRSATDIKRKMIRWQLVPVKKLELNNYLRLYVDNVTPTMSLYHT